MKIWVGLTDDDWFSFLRELAPDEVNFWQPSGSRPFAAAGPHRVSNGLLLRSDLHILFDRG